MQVEVTEEKIFSDGMKCYKGDRVTIPDELGESWCAAGWCTDMSGKVATGSRETENVSINPKKVQQNNCVTET